MKREQHIRLSGRPKEPIDIDLIAQAILLITEQRMLTTEVHTHDDGDAA